MQEQLSLIRKHVDREVARARTSGAPVGCGAYTAVGETLGRLVKLMKHMPRGDSLDWQVEMDSELGLNMDPQDFGEVVGNLLDNARKWAATSVRISVEPAGERARITLEDDGPGFGEGSHAARPERGIIGKPYESSSGLGLGIVEDILAEYGTKPVIESNSGFSVSFEIARCRDVPQEPDVSANRQEARTADAAASLALSPGVARGGADERRPGVISASESGSAGR